jgi:hypothetical protein
MASPILSCRAEEQPRGDNKAPFSSPDGHWVLGWITRKRDWPENLFHLSACKDGIAHLIGYVNETSGIRELLVQWHTDHRGNAHEWEREAHP